MYDKLLPFQKKDVDKLGPLTTHLIVNDMGTGKTYEAIALNSIVRQKFFGPTLVICPMSVLGSWKQHFEELTNLNIRVINPKKRQLLLAEDADVYVVHWDVLRLMPELAQIPWIHVIADECHRIQNRPTKDKKTGKTKSGLHVEAFRALTKKRPNTVKTAMSGTPYTTKVDKLWSILNWLDPSPSTKGGFGSYWDFYKKYVPWYEDYDGYKKIMTEAQAIAEGPEVHKAFLEREARLQARIAPFTVTHTKEEVTPELPEKYYTQIFVDLYPQQQRAYDDMRDNSLAFIGDNEDEMLPAPVVIAQLTRLQQFSNAYATVKVINNKKVIDLTLPSSKIDAALELIEDNPTKQIVFFSQFSKMINLFEIELKKRKISTEKLIGDVPAKLRPGMIKRFQAGDSQIFLTTIMAGGAGITLTSANTVGFFDRHAAAAYNVQAEDRCHRIGQVNSVQIIDILSKGTGDYDRRVSQEISWAGYRRLMDPARFC